MQQAVSDSDEATRLIRDATAQAERIKDEARVAARGEAQTITQNDRAQAIRIQDEARVVARAKVQTITQSAREEEQRIENEAHAQARRNLQDAQTQAAAAGDAAPAAAPLTGPFVSVFFQGELAAATNGFSAVCRVRAGGFGSVYVTQLPRLGLPSSHFAVKKLDMTSMQGETDLCTKCRCLVGVSIRTWPN